MNARALHRRLGWIAAVVALLWATTGFLHPIMSWTAPRPAVQAPPAQTLALNATRAPNEALIANGVKDATLVRLVTIDGAPHWFATTDTQRVVLDARTNAPAPDAEQTHAVALARHYAGLADTRVASATLVTEFSTEYPSVNRLLPVWQVRFDTPDGLTVYVDTSVDRLAAVTNDLRRALLFVFQNVHTLKWLEPIEPLRIAVLFALISTVIATTGLGAVMLLSAKGRGLRKAHTVFAWFALPVIAMFTLSGLFHLVMTTHLRAVAPPAPPSFSIAELPAPPQAETAITVNFLTATAGAGGAPIWRAQVADTGHYVGANAPPTDFARARLLAQAPANAAVTLTTRFSEEYGFINKRLPVLRVARADGPVFVDVREGVVAATTHKTALDQAEAWSFDMLHKWEFLNPIGRRNHDYATMAAAAIISLTALFGLLLLGRRAPKAAP